MVAMENNMSRYTVNQVDVHKMSRTYKMAIIKYTSLNYLTHQLLEVKRTTQPHLKNLKHSL
jgi:hypothetical protein